jgi:hypothetical protein
VTVELFGPARALAGRAHIEIAVDEPTDLRAFLLALTAALPAFVGEIVTGERDAFVAPNLLLLDGARAVGADVQFTGADRPCVLFLASGG